MQSLIYDLFMIYFHDTGKVYNSPWRQQPSQDLCPPRQITLSPVFGLMAQKPRRTTAHVGRILGTRGLQRFKVFRNPAGQSTNGDTLGLWLPTSGCPGTTTFNPEQSSWRRLSSIPCWQEMVLIVKMPVTNFRAIFDLLYIHLYFVPVKFRAHYISYVSLTNVSRACDDLLSVSKQYWY